MNALVVIALGGCYSEDMVNRIIPIY